MAAPSYGTDLTLITEANATTGFSEPTGGIAGGTPVAETDYYIQGGGCVSKTFNATGLGGLVYTAGSALTIPTDGAFLVWQYFAAPNALNTSANGGIRLVIGSGTAAYNAWSLGGSDTYQYGGWQCLAASPEVTPDYTQGTPTSSRQVFGWVANVSNAVSKGNPFGIDVMTCGRCEARFSGGDLANGYATFAGFAAVNDNASNRYGLIQAIPGGYQWQGLMTLGFGSAVDFRDSNKSIVVANTTKVTANFNKIEVRQATSRVDWTSISISALGTVSKGRFEAIDNADINIDGCTFTDMDTFVFQSNSTISDSTFRRCGQITQGGAVFDGGLITRSTAPAALLASNISALSNIEFVSAGTGHAIELSAAHAGGSYTLTNVAFTGYGAAGSTDAAIYNNSGGSVTINIVGGTTPTIRNGTGATTTVVSGTVTATLTVTDTTGTPIANANALVKAAAGGAFPADVTVTITNAGTTATVSHTAHGLATNDKVLIKGASHVANNGVFSITVTGANSYTYTMASAPGSNPTGTIRATFVVLYGLTNGSGQLSMSRVFSSDQPVVGWARKSSSPPYYKPGAIAGSVDSATGASFTALLIADQ